MAQKQVIVINVGSGSWALKPDGDVTQVKEFEGSISIEIEKGFSMWRTDLDPQERVENQPGFFDPG